jgi:toxin ParE1/3/4
LIEIREYIAQDRPQAAGRVAARIVDAIDGLERRPRMGRAGRVEGTRELVIAGTPFLAAYAISGNRVEVLAILHGAREWTLPGES